MQKDITKEIYKPNGRKFDFDSKTRIYNLGCGRQNYPGTIGVDKVDTNLLPHVKINHNLDIYPWPIPDNSADIVVAFHFIEHVGDLLKTMKEIHRITKKGGRVIVEVPHFRYSSAYKDPTHKYFFTCKTMNYFCQPNHSFMDLPFRFKLINLSIGWPATNPWTLKYWIKKWMTKRKNQDLYDNLLYLFFRANILVFELEVEK